MAQYYNIALVSTVERILLYLFYIYCIFALENYSSFYQ